MTGEALAIMARCRRSGIELVATGGRIRYRPAERVDSELRSRIAANKSAILAALSMARDDVDEAQCVYLFTDAADRRVLEALDNGEVGRPKKS